MKTVQEGKRRLAGILREDTTRVDDYLTHNSITWSCLSPAFPSSSLQDPQHLDISMLGPFRTLRSSSHGSAQRLRLGLYPNTSWRCRWLEAQETHCGWMWTGPRRQAPLSAASMPAHAISSVCGPVSRVPVTGARW